MSEWCASHPRYQAKREPGSICGRCWQLFFLRCPEIKYDYRRIRQEQGEARAAEHGQ